MNSSYIAFEGIDGCGKSTLAEKISSQLNQSGINNVLVREPGGTKVGEGIRNLLLSHEYVVSEFTEALLFAAQRSQLINEVVQPNIEKNIKIISDRSAYSSVAYQGVGRGLGYEKIYQLNDIAINSLWPQKIILLDIDPNVALKRQAIADRIGSDKIEFFEKVRAGYLQIAKKNSSNFLVLDGESSIEHNLTEINNWLNIDDTK
jgi:dTMP kinase